jgi:multiple sugar transport system permease protein
MIVSTLLVPPVIFLIPNYLIVQNLGWLDTIWAITVPGSAGAFGIFFLRQFFIGLPIEIEEAARLDGASDLRIFLQIVLPLSRPALATLAVLSFLSNWNDFLWPVYVLLSPENLTLQPGLSVLSGAYSTHFGIVMAGAVIASVPVLILFTLAQRQIVDSVAASGVKG